MSTSRTSRAAVLKEIGYDNAAYGFDCNTCAVLTAIDEQSGDIAMGVNESLELKAGGSGDDLTTARATRA